MPLLASIFNVAGIYGAYLVGVEWLGLDGGNFLVSNAKQHYLPLRRTQRLNQIRRFRRSRYVNRRTSGLPLRTDFRRYFACQYTHSSVFRPDHPRCRLHVDRMDVYRLKAV